MRYYFLRFPEGKFKAVTFSYDDAVRQDLRLAEIINRHGIKCAFNVNSAWLNDAHHLSTQELQALIKDGHEITVHGQIHRAPGVIRPVDGIREVLMCRLELEQMLGRIIRGMAYPDSGITRFSNQASYESIRHYLKDLGIVYARTLGGDNDRFDLPQDWYAWMPTAHHKNPKALEYAEKFAAITDPDRCHPAAHDARLFYLWGHSYEFDNDNNWEHLEKLCEVLGGKADTWYATNIEIYDYVTAYHSLVHSADGKTVYNPTLLKIWFEVDKKLYCIESGQTLTIEE
ncbi:MAG: polysaccharide deacetylase family protein [Clostridia bacterium]|nr:polysaccharide deacetylase family protein [Clostridia bacterium]